MAQKYWFKAHRHGYGWTPNSWQGWVILLVYFGGLVYSFVEIDSGSHSVSDTVINFLPRLFIFSALLVSISYLKGEPTSWRWGNKKRNF